MKRNLLILLAAAMTFSLCACVTNTDSPSTEPGLSSSVPSSIATEPLPPRDEVADSDLLHYGLYVQNGQLFYASFGDDISTIQIGSNLIMGDVTYWTRMGYAADIYLSQDGRYMIYSQGHGINMETYGYYVPSYYYIDLTNPDGDPIYVGDGTFEAINSSFDLFTQLGYGELYQYDLTGYTLIATDVEIMDSPEISDDGKCIYYVASNDDALYRWTADGGAELIAKGVTWHETAENFNTVFFIIDDRLYVKKLGQQAQLLTAMTAATGIQVNEDGTAYFYTTEEKGDFGLDIEIMMGDSIKTLHYYDGQETHIISDEVTDNDIMAYDFSETFFKTATGTYIAAKNSVGELPKGSIVYFYDGKYAIIGFQGDETTKASFYRLTIQGTQIVEEELLIEGLTGYSIDIFGTSVICLKDITGESFQFSEKFNGEYYSTEAGTLYLNSQYIDDNVKYYSVIGDEQNRNGILYYLKDWTPDTFYGTLCVYDGEKAETIMDNVYEMLLTPGGELMFLRNYDLTTYTGELWVYRDGTSYKLADNVSQILPAIVYS